jgi:iron complex outermembrane receptor protein
VGVKQGFQVGGFQGYVDLTAFQQEYEDYVEFTFGVWAQPALTNFGGLGFRSVNTGGARITGGEAEVTGTGTIGPIRLDVLLGYTYTLPVSTTPHEVYAVPQAVGVVAKPINYVNTSYDTTDNILKFRVQHLVRGDVRLGWRRFSLGTSVRYNSHVRNIDRIFVDLDEQAPRLLPTGAGEWMRTHTTGDWIVDLRLGFALTEKLKATFLVNNATNVVYAIRPMAIEAPRSYQVQLALDL